MLAALEKGLTRAAGQEQEAKEAGENGSRDRPWVSTRRRRVGRAPHRPAA